jgi:hypothetical protein
MNMKLFNYNCAPEDWLGVPQPSGDWIRLKGKVAGAQAGCPKEERGFSEENILEK